MEKIAELSLQVSRHSLSENAWTISYNLSRTLCLNLLIYKICFNLLIYKKENQRAHWADQFQKFVIGVGRIRAESYSIDQVQ